MNAWLETATGLRIPLHAVCSIGRSSKNALVLADEGVSRRHALIHAQAGEHWLVDLGSVNGILLNDHRVKQPSRLKDQDRLDIGANSFTFRQECASLEDSVTEQTTFMSIKEHQKVATWLIVADIEKSTHLSQTLPAEHFSQLVGGWFLGCKEVLEKYDGTINKYLGDGFLGYWPDPNTSPANVARSLGDLKKIQTVGGPSFRLVVHFGSVAVDKSTAQGEESLFGPEVNFTFRMEKLAGSLQETCLVSEPAAERLKAHAEVTLLGQHHIASFNGNFSFFRF